MRTAFIDTLCELAEQDERIWLLTGDLGYSVLERFANRFPGRFVNVGVAEQNMTGVAAGLALCEKVVLTYSIANFPTLRCLEQIRNDVCYHKLNVKVVAVGGGLAYGAQGMTHHATEDLAIMRALPNMTVVAPGDPVETHLATRAIVNWPGPCYLRLGKAGEAVVHHTPPDFQIGKAIVVRDGTDVTLISTGAMLRTVVEVAKELEMRGVSARVLSMHTVKPLDAKAAHVAAKETRLLLTVEEHTVCGGLGSAVAEVLAEEKNLRVPLLRFGIADDIHKMVGSQNFLLKKSGLSVHDLVEAICQNIVQCI